MTRSTEPLLDTEPSVAAESATAPAAAARARISQLPSLPESHRTIPIHAGIGWFKKVLAFAGPGYLVAVGYMDPGNWATDIGGGAKFGYTLLSVILISNVMAMILQALSAKLGIVTGRDLAQACRESYSRPGAIGLWIVWEIAIAACDLAEVLGSAVALKLLLCFAYEIFFAQPIWREAAVGFIPRLEILRNREMLYIAIGILGATVMPHNLYLHSSIVQTRAFATDASGKREAIRYATFDSTLALGFALFVNAAILVLGAAAFHTRGLHNVAEIADAYKLLTPVLGASLASTLFACALLASGQNSTLTGTLAGQIVMEGFLNLRLKPWLRRLITRVMAIVPAVIVIGLYGEGKVTSLLILSQVVLSFQLPFAVIPLVQFTNDRAKMGAFANSRFTSILAWTVAAAILGFNFELLWLTLRPA